jgi:hypothetical protein
MTNGSKSPSKEEYRFWPLEATGEIYGATHVRHVAAISRRNHGDGPCDWAF